MPIPTLKVRWRYQTRTCFVTGKPSGDAYAIPVASWDFDVKSERFNYGELVGVMGGQAVVVETKTGTVHLFGSGYLQRIPIEETP